MADNVAFTPGSGATGAADDIGGVYYPRVKIALGADGTAVDAVAGAGNVGTGVQRVTLADDDPAVGAINALTASQNANGRASATNSSPVVLSTEDKTSLDAIGNKLLSYSASATFTPAAASHTAGDVNGGAQEFTSMGPSAGRIMINSASLEIDGGTAEATAWRLALFNVTPPSAVADDGAFTLPSGDRASFLGFIELGTAIDEGDTQWIEAHGINKQVKLSGTSIFAYLINRTTLTPANVAHIVTLHATVL